MTLPPPSSTASPPSDPAAGRGDFARKLRFALWVLLVILLAAGLPAWFYLLRGGLLLERFSLLHSGWLGLSAACLGVWMLLLTTPPEALRLSSRASKRVLLGICTLLAITATAWLSPVLSDQVLRYRFDGHIWLLGLSPYTVSPDEAATLAADDPELRPDALDLAAPHPQRTTLNLPVSQAAFVATRTLDYLSPQGPAAALTWGTGPMGIALPSTAQAIEADWRDHLLALPWWRQLFFWRCLLAGIFLLTVAEMVAWLRARDLSPWWAAAFAWQPLVLVQSMGAGHQDLLGVLFLVAGLRRADGGSFRRAGICLAAAVAVKPLALLVLPFVLRNAWQGAAWARPHATPEQLLGKRSRRLIVWFSATLLLLLTPIWLGGGVPAFAGATADFFASVEHDAPLYRLLEAMFVGPEGSPQRAERVRLAAWLICALGTLLAGLIAWLRHVRAAAAFYAMMMIGLLLSPAVSPWLLMWPLAVVPVLRGRAGATALIWAGTAALYYMPATLAGGRPTPQMTLLQFGPVYVVAVLEAMVTSRHAARLRSDQRGERGASTAVAAA